jgi:hypothetical protein
MKCKQVKATGETSISIRKIMKISRTNIALCVPGVAALLLAQTPTHALPQFTPLLKPVSLGVLLSAPQNVLTIPVPSLPPMVILTAKASLGSGPLWSRTLDPSLWMTDWSHVFDIASLGSFDIPLRSDPAERTNILLSAGAVDNTVIAPGAVFSFNDQVGERTADRGYQDGLMLNNGQIVRGTGGGICLVATGLYNAALQAGLEITERHPHSGVVSYAPPGCDAGIYFSQEDLRFRNTTIRPIVIRTMPSLDHVTVQLFGQTPPPGRTVKIKPTWLETIPYSVITRPDPTLLPGTNVVEQKPRDGYFVQVERLWSQGTRIVRREIVVRERREPRPKIMRVALPPAVPVFPVSGTLTAAPMPPDAPMPIAVPVTLPRTDAEPGD